MCRPFSNSTDSCSPWPSVLPRCNESPLFTASAFCDNSDTMPRFSILIPARNDARRPVAGDGTNETGVSAFLGGRTTGISRWFLAIAGESGQRANRRAVPGDLQAILDACQSLQGEPDRHTLRQQGRLFWNSRLVKLWTNTLPVSSGRTSDKSVHSQS